MQRHIHKLAMSLAATAMAFVSSHVQAASLPETVHFKSADGQTQLVGYVFKDAQTGAARRPAVVMMHGRAGAYSSLAKGTYAAAGLSKRHKFWGETLAREGYVAILVDGFGPRGYPQGFPPHSYDERPSELDEVDIRPLDAYGALAYLRTRADVRGDAIALLGWSNGGSATLSALSHEAPGISKPTPQTGFRGGVAFYPACGLKGKYDDGLKSYAPVRIFMGLADEEVSPKRCQGLVQKSAGLGSDMRITIYPGATHGFDDPSRRRSDVPANSDATDDAVPKTLRFLADRLK